MYYRRFRQCNERGVGITSYIDDLLNEGWWGNVRLIERCGERSHIELDRLRRTLNIGSIAGAHSVKKMPTELVKTLSQNASIVGRYIGEHRVFTPTILVIL